MRLDLTPVVHRSNHTPQRLEATCLYCGKAFFTTPSRNAKGHGKFCSGPCHDDYRRNDTPDKFWAHVDKSGDCWLWHGGLYPNGYGKIRYSGASWPASRLAWVLTRGAIPEGMLVCHACDVNYPPGDITYRRCCRDDHLYLATTGQNTRDAATKGRLATGTRNGAAVHPDSVLRGERHWAAKIDEETARAILRDYRPGRLECRRLAEIYDVPEGIVFNVVHGRTWRHLR